MKRFQQPSGVGKISSLPPHSNSKTSVNSIRSPRNLARSLYLKSSQSLPIPSKNTTTGGPKIDSNKTAHVEEFNADDAAKRQGHKPNKNEIIEKFNHMVKGASININSLVRPTDNSLMKYNEARTPVVLEKYKLVLITNPKTGSTVLKQLMRRMMGYENDYHVHEWGMDGLPHKWPANGLNYTAHYSLKKVNEMMTSDKWTRAMFVRDPKERALSAYLMLRPRVKLAPAIVRKARRGLFTNESIAGIFPDVMPMQVANCCTRRNGVDANWKILCLNHVSEFEGFLDAIANPKSKFGRSHSENLFRGREFSPETLHDSPGCWDVHWAPLTHWRLEKKFFATLNFVGHLETAQQDIRRLLDRLSSDAWTRYGASGWGKHGNESMFESSSTVNHASDTTSDYYHKYFRKGMGGRVDRIYEDDYENLFLNLTKVPIGKAR